MKTISFQEAIKNYLDELAEKDKLFAKTYKKKNKSIEECCNYITQQIQKSRKKGETCVAVPDDVVFNLAVHYYDEDNIEKLKPASDVKVAVASPRQTPKAKAKVKEEDSEIPDELNIPLF